MSDPEHENAKLPFWERKSLAEMTPEEWESLCDGCGRCCLHKLEDEEGRLHFTAVACRLLDIETIRCRDYARRSEFVKDCLRLGADATEAFSALPHSCAYRTLAERRRLADWHPLVSGEAASVRNAGISMHGRVVSERDVDLADLERYVFED